MRQVNGARELRICFFITELSDGGAQPQCVALANELAENWNVAVVLVRLRTGIYDPNVNRNLVEERWLPARTNFDPRIVHSLGRLLRNERIDILVTWLPPADLIGCCARFLAPKSLWIMTERNSSYQRRLRFRVREWMGRFASAILPNSQAGAAYWSAVGREDRCHVVTNIAPRADAEVAVIDGHLKFDVLYIGRLEEQKNVLRATAAMIKVSESFPDYRFGVVGKGALLEEVRALVERDSSGDRISVLGHRRDVPTLLRNATVILSLSHHEGQPNVILEAIAAGVPVVASDIREHVDLLGVDYPFLVKDRYSVQDATTILSNALSDEHRGSVLESATKRLEEMTPSNVAAAYVGVFRSVLARKKLGNSTVT